jgi:hypothetical protein
MARESVEIGKRFGHWLVMSEGIPLSMAGHDSHLCECLCGSREFISHLKLAYDNYPRCSECNTYKKDKHDRN